jgi:hypothetical protein
VAAWRQEQWEVAYCLWNTPPNSDFDRFVKLASLCAVRKLLLDAEENADPDA